MSFHLPTPKIQKWTLHNSTTVATYRVFGLDRHDVMDSAGKARHQVMTFTCPEWCNVIALTQDDQIVLVWQYRFGTQDLSLELPGGIVDPKEEPIAAARRELREETGYLVDSVEPFCVVHPNPAMQGNSCHTFTARGASLQAATDFDENEELEVVLVPRKELGPLLDSGLVTNVIILHALERYLRLHAS